MRVSQLMQANAHQELPFRLYWISRSLKEQHQNLIKGIVLGVVRSLADAKKIQGTAQEFLDQLKLRVQREEERLLKESLSMTAPEPLAGEKSTPESVSLPDLGGGDPDNANQSGTDVVPARNTADHPHLRQSRQANLSISDYDSLDTTSAFSFSGAFLTKNFHHTRVRSPLLKSARGKKQAAKSRSSGVSLRTRCRS
jgi:hypothetical protein